LTPGAGLHTLKAMEVHFTPEMQAKLESVAAANRRGADEYVQQLVESYVDHDAWFRLEVAEGLRQLDRGEFLTHEEVGARLEKKFQSWTA
jgi:predicted transcriptional regulator